MENKEKSNVLVYVCRELCWKRRAWPVEKPLGVLDFENLVCPKCELAKWAKEGPQNE